MHDEELHNLHSLSNDIRINRMRWADHVERMEGMRNVSIMLVGKPEGRVQLEDLEERP
jgi:hypothetical protein